MVDTANNKLGALAQQCGQQLPLGIHESANGFYVGTVRTDPEIGFPTPYTRESKEYWSSHAKAVKALRIGAWQQRTYL